MNCHLIRAKILAAVCLTLPQLSAWAGSGADLATKLRAKESGASFVRIRMQVDGATLQVQIKSRISDAASDIVYQILFPKERKGESVLLHQAGHKFSGTSFTPPNTVKPIGSGEMSQPLFGTALSYEDVIDSPFSWSQQAIVGTDVIDRFPCQILESKPNSDHNSSYASVKTWVDTSRMVPLRIEKYDSSGKVVRRINITRMLLDGGDSLPADFDIAGPRGSVTHITGSGLKRGLNYAETEFTSEGLKQLKIPSE